jgi:hypothetical protein
VVTGAAWLDSAAALVELDSLEAAVPAEEPLVPCELAAGVVVVETAGVVVVETAGALVAELVVFVDSAGSWPEASCT